MERRKLEIYPYVASAMSLNKKTWYLIDKIYNSNEDILILYGTKSQYWDKPPIATLPVQSLVYARRLLCMFEYINSKVQSNENEEEIESDPIVQQIEQMLLDIYKKAFNNIYQLIHSFDKIEFKKIITKLAPKAFKGFSWEGISYANNEMILFIFGAKIFGKEIIEDESYHFFLETLKTWIDFDIENKDKMTFKLLQDYIKKGRQLRRTIESNNKYFNNFEFIGKMEKDIPTLHVIISYIFDLFGIDVIDTLCNNIEYSDIENIYAFTELCLQIYKDCSEEEKIKKAEDIVIIALYFWNILKEYTTLRKLFLDMQNHYFKMRQQFNDYEKLQKNLELLQKEYLALNEEKSLLQKKLDYYKAQLEKTNEDMKELAKLRSVIFAEETKQKFSQQSNYATQQIDLAMLEKLNVAFIGGYKGQFENMKKYFSQFVHIEVDRLNYDETILANMDLIVFITKILNHTGYYKVINVCKKHNIDYILTSYQNEEKILQEIIDFIKNQNKN